MGVFRFLKRGQTPPASTPTEAQLESRIPQLMRGRTTPSWEWTIFREPLQLAVAASYLVRVQHKDSPWLLTLRYSQPKRLLEHSDDEVPPAELTIHTQTDCWHGKEEGKPDPCEKATLHFLHETFRLDKPLEAHPPFVGSSYRGPGRLSLRDHLSVMGDFYIESPLHAQVALDELLEGMAHLPTFMGLPMVTPGIP